MPQRSNGRLRVAAILEAAAAVIDERGYETATMSEIAARSGTKIGSLYRFFPNKEILAETIVRSARENLDAIFDGFDAGVRALSVRALADGLLELIYDYFTQPAFLKLLDAAQNGSLRRNEFRRALLERVATTLTIHTPKLSKPAAGDIAFVVLLNAKAAATHRAFLDTAPDARNEIRDMTRLYLQSRLRASRT